MNTRGRKLLKEWMSQDESRTQCAVADAIGVRQSAVSEWRSGKARPRDRLRVALETLTDGHVGRDSWLSEKERESLDAVQPMRAVGT